MSLLDLYTCACYYCRHLTSSSAISWAGSPTRLACQDPVASVYAVLVEQLVGQLGYCMRPCSISVCSAGGATGRADWLLHETL